MRHNSLKIAAPSSPLREEGIDYPITKRVDGQLWDSLEVFTAEQRRKRESFIGFSTSLSLHDALI